MDPLPRPNNVCNASRNRFQNYRKNLRENGGRAGVWRDAVMGTGETLAFFWILSFQKIAILRVS